MYHQGIIIIIRGERADGTDIMPCHNIFFRNFSLNGLSYNSIDNILHKSYVVTKSDMDKKSV